MATHAVANSEMSSLEGGAMPPTPKPLQWSKDNQHHKKSRYSTRKADSELRVKDIVVPVSFATVLFAWEFAYGFLDTMNAKIKQAMGLSQVEAALFDVAYYAAYLFIPFCVAGPVVRRCGYTHAFILGLVLLGIGNFVVSFVPKAISTGEPAYLVMVMGIFVIGLGISTSERSANPYVTYFGPVKWTALRLNLAQCGAALGFVVSPLVAAKFIFEEPSVGVITEIPQRATGAKAMESVVGLYQGTGIVVLGITLLFGAVFFCTNHVPEVPGDPHAVEDKDN